MISFNSFKNFIYLNGFILIISTCEFKIINYFADINSVIKFFVSLLVFLCRNYILLEFITNQVKSKENVEVITKGSICEEKYKNNFHFNVLTYSFIDATTYTLIKYMFFQHQTTIIFYNDFLFLIPKSFIFEVIFDFFHYCTHRILHSNKFLYINIHKYHHEYSYVIPIATFHQEPLDLIITGTIPLIMTLIIFPHISLFQFIIIVTYKIFTEIVGHSGKKMYPNGSFIQFIWLPRFFNINLHTEDHSLHHILNNCNYAKRFSLWDKIFNTYICGHSMLIKKKKEIDTNSH